MSSAEAEPLAAPAPAELARVALLVLAALLAGLWSLLAPLRADFGGYQGAFYSTSALSFERTGALRFGGYPYLLPDEPALAGKDDLVAVDAPEGRLFAYRNHPPTSFFIGWLGARLFGPSGWQTRHERGEPPGVEHAVAAPFLVLHLAALLALWWWLRAELGVRAALLALALAASAPAALHYGSLPNLENPCQPFVFLAFGAHARWRRGARPGFLALLLAALAAAAAVTWAALFAAVPLAALEFARRRARAAACILGAVALPFALQIAWAAHCLPREESLLARPARLFAPLVDGSLPPQRWLSVQLVHLFLALGLPLCLAALVGAWRAAPSARRALGLAGASWLGYFLAFWRHTGDEQLQFQLWSVPLAALAAALALDRLAPRLCTGACAALVLAGAAGLVLLERRLEPDARPGPAASAARIAALVPRAQPALVADELGLNLAYGYCAWRRLVALSDATRYAPELAPRGRGTPLLEWDAAAREWRLAHW